MDFYIFADDRFNQLESICQRLYAEKSLNGEPGTGKTSFIVALGEFFKIPVFIFDIATFTNDDLEREWNNVKTSTPCFVVFEDFDSVFEGRVNVHEKSAISNRPISFDCVLNIIDGAVKFDGIVTFLTTNNIDKIDPALGGGGNSRPGRIDYVYEMNGIGRVGRKFIANIILEGVRDKESVIDELLDVNVKTPAQFKELCINVALEKYVTEELKSDK